MFSNIFKLSQFDFRVAGLVMCAVGIGGEARLRRRRRGGGFKWSMLWIDGGMSSDDLRIEDSVDAVERDQIGGQRWTLRHWTRVQRRRSHTASLLRSRYQRV